METVTPVDGRARFGSRVTLLNSAARLLPREDPDVADAVAASLADAGVELVHAVRAQGFVDNGTDVVQLDLGMPASD